MRFSSSYTNLFAILIALAFMFGSNIVHARDESSAHKMNPYLADCYKSVTYLGQVGHHFSVTLPHTKSCSLRSAGNMPPGLSLKGCTIEGTPSAPGRWNINVLLEAKCQGIDFGELKIPVDIIIEGRQ